MKTNHWLNRISGLGGSRRWFPGFTLLELLTVIAIIGILAAIVGPTLNSLKPNVVAAATQQLLTDVGRARQLAISQRTTVYMVFVPPGFWNDPVFQALPPTNRAQGLQLLDKQMTGYNFVSLRSIGDQPGQPTVRYLSSWKALPDGMFIPIQKFTAINGQHFGIYTNSAISSGFGLFTNVYGFNISYQIPFPTEQTPPAPNPTRPYPAVPYIAFNYLGQLVSWTNVTEMIPLAKGSVIYPHDPLTHTNVPPALPSAVETPPGNSTTNSFNLVSIDWLTGRARVLRNEIR